MALELLTVAGIPTAICATEAVRQQNVLDEEAESDDRQAPFHLTVYCDAQSRKRHQVHDAIVVLSDGKLMLWPRDANTDSPKPHPHDSSVPHPFRGFYYPFPVEDLPDRPIPAAPVLGLVSTIPPDELQSSAAKGKAKKPKLNWIYADRDTRELKYGPRKEAKHHIIGPWDWTEEDEQGLTLDGKESLVAVEEEKGGYGWAVYWDKDDDRLKGYDIGREKRVLRCSLERKLIAEDDTDGSN